MYNPVTISTCHGSAALCTLTLTFEGFAVTEDAPQSSGRKGGWNAADLGLAVPGGLSQQAESPFTVAAVFPGKQLLPSVKRSPVLPASGLGLQLKALHLCLGTATADGALYPVCHSTSLTASWHTSVGFHFCRHPGPGGGRAGRAAAAADARPQRNIVVCIGKPVFAKLQASWIRR